MKKILTVITDCGRFVMYPSICFSSYILHLTDGRVCHGWSLEEGEQIKFNRYGGVIGIQKKLVSEIELLEEVPEVAKRAVAGNLGCLTSVL